MTKAKTGWLLLATLCLASFAVAQDAALEKYMKAGVEARQEGRYADAEKQFKAALQEAEKFGKQDPRLGVILLALGTVYKNKGQYTEAQPLLKRALAILEKALGPQHPTVAGELLMG